MTAKRLLSLAVIVAGCFLAAAGPAPAAERVVLVLADGMSPQSVLLEDRPELARLIREGGVGLVNTRTGRPQNRAAGYATL